jgi:hypothetical protein
MANWSLPSLTDLYTNFLAYLKGRDDDAARLNDNRVANATNLPDYAKRWNNTTKTFQEWVSSIWGNLVMGVAGGGTGASNIRDARTNLSVYSIAEADAAFTINLDTEVGDTGVLVSMTTPATYYDAVSVTLAAGTWLVLGTVSVSSGGETYVNGRFVVGGTPKTNRGFYLSWVDKVTSFNTVNSCPLNDVFVLGSSSIVKIQALRVDYGNIPLLWGTLTCVRIA